MAGIGSDPSIWSSDQQREYHINAKNFSIDNVLGFGFRREGEKLLRCNHKIANSNIDDIIIDKPVSFFETIIGINQNEIANSIDKKFNLIAGFKGIGLIATCESSEESDQKSRQLKYIVRRIEGIHCQSTRKPTIVDNIGAYDVNRHGHCVALVGFAYIGYELIFTIDILEDKAISTNEANIDIAVTLGNFELGISGESASKSLRNVKCGKIHVSSRGIGYSAIPSITKNIDNSVDIIECIASFDSEFLRRLPSISTREYYVSPLFSDWTEDIVTYFRSSTPPTNNALAPVIKQYIPIEDGFLELAERMYDSCTDKEKGILKIALEGTIAKEVVPAIKGMIESIEGAFHNIFEITSLANKSTYTAVMGLTGAGKSLLIGTLLGGRIEETDNCSYRFVNSTGLSLPEVSASRNSVSRGGSLYGTYIDTAGLFDTKGIEMNICNSMAIHLAFSSHTPKRLIIVISPSYFDNRAMGLREIFRMLKVCIRSFPDEDTLSSILFVLNKQILASGEENTTEGGLHRLISQRLKILRNDINTEIMNFIKKHNHLISKNEIYKPFGSEVLPSVASRMAGAVSSFIYAPATEVNIHEILNRIHRIDPEFVEEVKSYIEDINTLESLWKGGRFIIIDFSISEQGTYLKPNGFHHIKKWQESRTTGYLKKKDFVVKNLIHNGESVFRTIIRLIVSYFNRRFTERSNMKSDIDSYKVQLTETLSEIEEIRKNLGSGTSDEGIIDKKNEAIKASGKCTHDLGLLKVEIDNLRNNINPMYINPPIVATEPITPRNFFSHPVWAKEYIFEYKSHAPIIGVKMTPSEYRQDISRWLSGPSERGGFYFSEDKSDGKDGTHMYKIRFLPRWWGHKKDRDANIIIQIATKDHPDTHASIKDKELLETKLDAEKKELDDKITGYTTELIQTDTQRINSKNQSCILIREKLKNAEHDIIPIEEEIKKFRNFCILISKITSSREYHEDGDPFGILSKFETFCLSL